MTSYTEQPVVGRSGEPNMLPQNGADYPLDELLPECDASADITAEDRVWLDGEPVGHEVL